MSASYQQIDVEEGSQLLQKAPVDEVVVEKAPARVMTWKAIVAVVVLLAISAIGYNVIDLGVNDPPKYIYLYGSRGYLSSCIGKRAFYQDKRCPRSAWNKIGHDGHL